MSLGCTEQEGRPPNKGCYPRERVSHAWWRYWVLHGGYGSVGFGHWQLRDSGGRFGDRSEDRHMPQTKSVNYGSDTGSGLYVAKGSTFTNHQYSSCCQAAKYLAGDRELQLYHHLQLQDVQRLVLTSASQASPKGKGSVKRQSGDTC